jgi:hypothetical protein
MLLQMTQISSKCVVAVCLDFSPNPATEGLWENKVHQRHSTAAVPYDT